MKTVQNRLICKTWGCILLIAFLVAGVSAQDVALQIERDVWIPLLAASGSFDADAFLALQSRDLVRISVDSNEVYGLSRYQKEIRDGFPRAKARGITRKSEVRFLQRNHSDDLAHETGYFRSEVTMSNGDVRVRYSRVEFVLRKEIGKWRILVDKDTADGGKITAEQFSAAAPMRSAVKR